ncbi:MAG: EAL domain-containing protein [Burkholderiales bacterium]|nr:EAL domain-containing protein [Burkholderiales bacterium]MDE1927259.1 EAL domain-containing protein [Burkholderiales bacterium]MDE2157691.1 EAL domain-containing protein [Burkholderiales bacterium]MDE2503544.1 EAL domain-containing protein [Burkholderiales bacterium]
MIQADLPDTRPETGAAPPFEIPSGEDLRLADLAHYRTPLDTPDDDLTQLARLVATLTKTPFAGVSLVDDAHVWLKARVGVDATCLVREGAFCGHAIESRSDIFRVPDALRDPRFAGNPLVVGEPRVRMYASAVLHSAAGYPVGTLWIMDRVARELSDFERDGLLALGTHAVHLLHKRRRHPVSGLPTREVFISHLQCALGRDRAADDRCRNADCPHMRDDGRCASGRRSPQATVGFIALQNLALVRSAYGELSGRALVARLGALLGQWVGPRNLLAHLEGDDFGFALLEEPARARQALEQLEQLLAHPVEVDGALIHAACSVGVSIAPAAQALASAMLDQAAVAASTVTAIDSASVRVYDPHTRDSTRLWGDFQRSFPEDIANRRLVPHYQPQVDVRSGRITGFEALARFRHPTRGLVGPDAFLALAAHAGLARMVDMCILDAVCADLAQWQRDGLEPVPVSINLARSTLMLASTVDAIEAALARHGLSRGLLVVEFLEDGIADAGDGLREACERLRHLGIKVALDDFGTGRSNLASLQSMRFEYLKVDRCFVHGVSTNLHAGGVLRLVAGFAELFGMRLICEGVEDEADLHWAESLGCRYFQGWYFSRAVDAAAAARMLGVRPPAEVPAPAELARWLARMAEGDAA